MCVQQPAHVLDTLTMRPPGLVSSGSSASQAAFVPRKLVAMVVDASSAPKVLPLYAMPANAAAARRAVLV